MSLRKLNNVKKKIQKELVCTLKDEAKNMVFGKGNPTADILFIGEAPGAKEDEVGLPFVGRSGQELDKQLQIIGLSIDDVYIANILKYRPPKNRNPTREEMINHTPYLIDQIKIIQPKIIVPLGNYATKFVLAGFTPLKASKIDGISILHGKILLITLGSRSFQVMPMYHPAAMMYNGKLRVHFEADFEKINLFLNSKPLKKPFK